jgi:hypothetical protein
MSSDFNNQGMAFFGNTVKFVQYAYSADTARQSTFPSLLLQPSDTVAATALTGSVALTTLKTYAGWIQSDTFNSNITKTLRIRGAGKSTGVAGTKSIQFAVTGPGVIGTFVIPAAFGAAGATAFWFEFGMLCRAAANSQSTYGYLVFDQSAGTPGGVLALQAGTGLNLITGADLTMTISGQLGNAADTLALNLVEPGWESG